MTSATAGNAASAEPIHETLMEASDYFRIRTRIAPSGLEGAGLGAFTMERVPRGTLLGLDLPDRNWIISAQDALELPRHERMQTWRHVEDICFRGGQGNDTPANYINHSFEPNVLWHLGCYWTLVDLEAGDELLLDYRPLIDPSWSGRIVDTVSGRKLLGIEGKQALLESAQTLVSLLQDVLDGAEGPQDVLAPP